jgi:hypothetical protein
MSINTKSVSTNFNTYDDFHTDDLNQVLNDTLKKIANVTGSSQVKSVDLLHAQLIQESNDNVKLSEFIFHLNKPERLNYQRALGEFACLSK